MKKETLVSIAERSGCSISTVSRVLSGNAAKYRISQRTVARVTEEIKRCNYTPSLLAKGLRTGIEWGVPWMQAMRRCPFSSRYSVAITAPR